MMLSRVADSFYWIGRYTERAEHACRLLQITLTAGLEAGAKEADASAGRALLALEADWAGDRLGVNEAVHQLTFGKEGDVSSVLTSVFAARENARQVRDQITTEMWERLNRLYFRVKESETQTISEGWFRFYEDAISDLHAFKGIVSGTMSHGEGYHFLSLGRSLESAQLMVRLLELHFQEDDMMVAEYGWVQLLRMCCGLEPFLRVKTSDFRRDQIADFLVLNNEFPRALRFCANTIAMHIEAVGVLADDKARLNCSRQAGRLAARLNYALLDEVTSKEGTAFIAQVADDCNGIAEAIHSAFISYSLAERLPSHSLVRGDRCA